MSRAVNIAALQAQVLAMCEKHNAAISAIEALHSGGTRVVFKNAAGAAVVKTAFGSKVILGAVTRTPSRLMHN